MNPITNVGVIQFDTERLYIQWEYAGARYHINTDERGINVSGHLYKNPIPVMHPDGIVRYLCDGDPGYYPSRKLNARNKANAMMIERVLAIVRDRDLIPAAVAAKVAVDAEKAAKQQARNATFELARETLRNMSWYLTTDGPNTYNITRDQMRALLETAPEYLLEE